MILNGAPRSGKSSIAAAMQERLAGIWINFGVDVYQQAVPRGLHPSIGLRPGGERQDVERHLPVLFAALYESVAAHSRLGLNVAVDVGHHDGYAKPLHVLEDGLRRLHGLPVLLVGVRCALSVVLDRRGQVQDGRANVYEQAAADGHVPAPILAWQHAVHVPGFYDLDVDTAVLSPREACARIGAALRDGVPGPSAAERIAKRAGDRRVRSTSWRGS